jgi:hypothetical protein
MSDSDNVMELRLDPLTRTVRVLAAVGPKAMTRVTLGVVLAADDVSNDPASEILSIKLTEGVMSIAATVASIARTTAAGVGSVTASAKLDQVPGLSQAKAFVSEAASEVKQTWESAGYVAVQVFNEDVASESEDPAASTPQL